MEVDCVLGTDVCHWVDFFCCKVNMVKGQKDSTFLIESNFFVRHDRGAGDQGIRGVMVK